MAKTPVALCQDFPDAPSCCISCHEDMEAGIEDVPIEVENLERQVVARVCCAKLRWIEEYRDLAAEVIGDG